MEDIIYMHICKQIAFLVGYTMEPLCREAKFLEKLVQLEILQGHIYILELRKVQVINGQVI